MVANLCLTSPRSDHCFVSKQLKIQCTKSRDTGLVGWTLTHSTNWSSNNSSSENLITSHSLKWQYGSWSFKMINVLGSLKVLTDHTADAAVGGPT